MAVETHALILHEGEDIVEELFRNFKNGSLMTRLAPNNFKALTINNLKLVKMIEGGKAVWVEVTVSF